MAKIPKGIEKEIQEAEKKPVAVRITPPNMQTAMFRIIGTAPYVQLRFSEKAKGLMRSKMEQEAPGGKKNKKRSPRDYGDDYLQATYISTEGWHGINAASFRNAAISACRVADFKMTMAKLSIFCMADGYDAKDGTPLVRIEHAPHAVEHPVRNANGSADLRIRAMWNEWAANVRIRFDADQFSLTDVANLMARVGEQVGVGEGRADSKNSAGMGWGSFRIAQEDEK